MKPLRVLALLGAFAASSVGASGAHAILAPGSAP